FEAGGIEAFTDGTAVLTLNNTIVAGNLRQTAAGNVPDDIQGTASDSSSSNLVGVGSGSNLSNNVNGNHVGTLDSPLHPQLGPRQNNGGPSQTLALKPGSPAIDKGNNDLAVDQDGRPLAADQRGFDRTSGDKVDIGAFEVQQPDLDPAALPDGLPGTAYSQAI